MVGWVVGLNGNIAILAQSLAWAWAELGNNSTLFPSTFKVEENKVPLFFILRQNNRDMAILLFFHQEY